jgi:hypothetical protein
VCGIKPIRRRYFTLNLQAPILRQTLKTLKSSETAVTIQKPSSALKTVNFIAGLALLVMLFPIGGKLPEKPAGVRTALELIAKKQAAFQVIPNAAAQA